MNTLHEQLCNSISNCESKLLIIVVIYYIYDTRQGDINEVYSGNWWCYFGRW